MPDRRRISPAPLPLHTRVLLAIGPVMMVVLFPAVALLWLSFWIHERIRVAIVERRRPLPPRAAFPRARDEAANGPGR